MAGIYIHIPFCKQACYYCDFHFTTSLQSKNDVFSAISQELHLRATYLGSEEVSTVYFGGGTPSLASVAELEGLLTVIKSHFTLASENEITLEANPDDLTPQKLRDLRSVGFNRLSIGIQSFDDGVLRFLNRAHESRAAIACVAAARDAGFNNISIDLIYSIPTQSHGQWINNVRQAIALKPEHISAYSLTIEEKTVFGNWSARGKLTPVDEEASARDLETLIDLLEGSGYEQYEISNFALPGYYSRHNSSYWKQEKYLGIGPSAHSYNGLSRQYNVSNNYQYIDAIRRGVIPASIESLSREDMINDYLLTTLRTSWGSDLLMLAREFDYSPDAGYMASLINNGLAIVQEDRLILTRKGRFVADKICADLFVSP